MYFVILLKKLMLSVVSFQKNGVHLSRAALVNHCRTDPAFLSFVSDMVPTAVKVGTKIYQYLSDVYQ